jgi:hypothetical protein
MRYRRSGARRGDHPTPEPDQQRFSELKRYLANSDIVPMDLLPVNQGLAAQGRQVRSEFRHCARQMMGRLRNGSGPCTGFWLATTPAGVAESDHTITPAEVPGALITEGISPVRSLQQGGAYGPGAKCATAWRPS